MPALIYDGDCGFCSASVRWGERSIRRWPSAVPFQAADLAEYGLTPAECAAAVQYVSATGQVHSAHLAVSQLLVDAGGGWRWLGRCLQLPLLRSLAAAIYRTVARNRHRLPGATAACAWDAESAQS